MPQLIRCRHEPGVHDGEEEPSQPQFPFAGARVFGFGPYGGGTHFGGAPISGATPYFSPQTPNHKGPLMYFWLPPDFGPPPRPLATPLCAPTWLRPCNQIAIGFLACFFFSEILFAVSERLLVKEPKIGSKTDFGLARNKEGSSSDQ